MCAGVSLTGAAEPGDSVTVAGNTLTLVINGGLLRPVTSVLLRAADALQLAAAIEWAGTPVSGGFVTFDQRLARAAEREGFDIV